MTSAQKIARARNWNKRVITGHMTALQTTLFNNGLSNSERNKITHICNLCKDLLSDWSKTLDTAKE